MSSGLKACLNYGWYGNAKTAATVEHSFWKMVILPRSFKKIGEIKVKELEARFKKGNVINMLEEAIKLMELGLSIMLKLTVINYSGSENGNERNG